MSSQRRCRIWLVHYYRMIKLQKETFESTSPVWVDSETERLRRVIIGSPETFVLPEPINQKQRRWLEDPASQPSLENLIPEFESFQTALEKRGVEVVRPKPVNGVPDQLTPRDIGVVIGDIFVRTRMATACRANEWRGIEDLMNEIPESNHLVVPDRAVLEGGDIVVDQEFIFVGTGERSTPNGVAFLREHFGEHYDVVPVPLRGESHGEDVLHLDCAFVPVGHGKALIYPEGIAKLPEAMYEAYDWITVNKEEQQLLATNVLSIDPQTVISRNAAPRVNANLRDHGFEVIEMVFTETPKSGGSFRCASLPLQRDCKRTATG